MIHSLRLLAAGLTILFLPLQPRAAAAERFPTITVGTITVGKDDFRELFGSGTKSDSLSLRLFEEYALKLAAAAEAGAELHQADRSADAVVARQMAVMDTESLALDSLAANDTITSRQLFDMCRDSLQWDAPRFKGEIVMAMTQEQGDSATAMLRTMTSTDHYERRAELMRRFGKSVRLVKLLVGRGANRWADHAVWGDPLPSPTVAEPWTAAMTVEGRILDQPEEPSDVADRLEMINRSRLKRLYIERLRSRFEIRYND